ncbi:MAG: P-II family nitrogen regulator [Pseudomonadota bacterium]
MAPKQRERVRPLAAAPFPQLSVIYRGAKEVGGLLRKVRLDIAVNEEFVEPTIAAVNKEDRTGEGTVGDGKIFVQDQVDFVRISLGERGRTAIG